MCGRPERYWANSIVTRNRQIIRVQQTIAHFRAAAAAGRMDVERAMA